MFTRILRTSLRAIHLIAVAAYYGGNAFDVAPERMEVALASVLGSGLLFMAYEVWRSPLWLVQVRGAATFLKVALLLLVPVFWSQRMVLLTVMMVVGVFVSHMPSGIRYYSLAHGRVVESDGKG